MKNLITLTALLLSSLSFAVSNHYPDLICNGGQTFIKRGRTLAWGGVESFFMTKDPAIKRFTGQRESLNGFTTEEKSKQRLIKGDFSIFENNWERLVPGGSIVVEELVSTDIKNRKLELKIIRNAMIGCAKQEIVSGCYAGDSDCITRCVQEVNIPEIVYFKKKLICYENGMR